MKVVISREDEAQFDNGLRLYGEHMQDCCERNYLDFEQLPVGTEIPTMTAKEFYNTIKIKDDGFIITATDSMPKWVQARSSQNGYYSNGVNLVIEDDQDRIVPQKKGQDGELFNGKEG